LKKCKSSSQKNMHDEASITSCPYQPGTGIASGHTNLLSSLIPNTNQSKGLHFTMFFLFCFVWVHRAELFLA
jgi:hypothetical protein